MLKFRADRHRVVIDGLTLLVGPLRDFYYSQSDDGAATDVLSYVHLVAQVDPDAPYFQARMDEVYILAAKGIWGLNYEERIKLDDYDHLVDAYVEAFDKPEVRLLRVYNHKIDQIQDMIEKTDPQIEKSTNLKIGTFTYVSNTEKLSKMMRELGPIMDQRDEIVERVKQTREKDKKIRGGKTESYLERKRRTKPSNRQPDEQSTPQQQAPQQQSVPEKQRKEADSVKGEAPGPDPTSSIIGDVGGGLRKSI